MNSQLSTLNSHPQASVDWRRVAAIVNRELDRADIGDRATRLARVLVALTLRERRTEVLLPDRQELCRLLSIGDNHIAQVFEKLTAAKIVECEKKFDGWLVRVFARSESWNVAWHFDRDALCAFVAGVNAAPGQVQGELFEPEPCLRAALAEGDAAAAAGPDFPKREAAVPKKGSGPEADRAEASGAVPLRSSRLSQFKGSLEKPSEGALKPGKPLDIETRARGKAFTPSERELLERLRSELGPDQVEQWGGYWVKHFVRPMPHALGVALDELHARRQEGVSIGKPAHWLQSTARHVERARAVHFGNAEL